MWIICSYQKVVLVTIDTGFWYETSRTPCFIWLKLYPSIICRKHMLIFHQLLQFKYYRILFLNLRSKYIHALTKLSINFPLDNRYYSSLRAWHVKSKQISGFTASPHASAICFCFLLLDSPIIKRQKDSRLFPIVKISFARAFVLTVCDTFSSLVRVARRVSKFQVVWYFWQNPRDLQRRETLIRLLLVSLLSEAEV